MAATANPHKLVEIAAILGSAVELLPRPGDLGEVVEDGDTLEANARLKAVAVCGHTGQAAVADDTGLEVAALGGAPGVKSARYAGEHADDADNRTRLLEELEGAADRSARFRTVAVVAFPDGGEIAGRRDDHRDHRRRVLEGTGASATTRCSFPTGETGARLPRCHPTRRTPSPTGAGHFGPWPPCWACSL